MKTIEGGEGNMNGNQLVGVMAAILLAVGMMIWSQTLNKSLGPFITLGS